MVPLLARHVAGVGGMLLTELLTKSCVNSGSMPGDRGILSRTFKLCLI